MKLFVVLAVATFAVANAAPASSPAKKSTVGELLEVVREYQTRFEDLTEEKDQQLQFARTGLFATYRRMNEDLLVDLGNTRNAIEYGFDEIRTKIAQKILEGGDEECLLAVVADIVAEQRALAAGMSVCSTFTTDAKDDLASSFHEILDLLQRLSTALSEYVLWSFSNFNSVAEPQEHADYLRRTYDESADMWEKQVLPLLQFELDAMEHNRPLIVADNKSCLDKLEEQMVFFNEHIQEELSHCIVPLKN